MKVRGDFAHEIRQKLTLFAEWPLTRRPAKSLSKAVSNGAQQLLVNLGRRGELRFLTVQCHVKESSSTNLGR